MAKQAASPNRLADSKLDLLGAVRASADYLHSVLQVSATHKIGTGANGPLNHQRAKDWVDRSEGVASKQPEDAANGTETQMPYTQLFWDSAKKVIAASEEHSFLLKMVEGTLPKARFQCDQSVTLNVLEKPLY